MAERDLEAIIKCWIDTATPNEKVTAIESRQMMNCSLMHTLHRTSSTERPMPLCACPMGEGLSAHGSCAFSKLHV